MSLKLVYDLPDLLDWSYHANRDMFDAAVKATSRYEMERALCCRYYNLKFRDKLLAAAGCSEPTNAVVRGDWTQEEIDHAFGIVAERCHTLLPYDEETFSWLRARGITEEQIERHGIGTSRGYNPLALVMKFASPAPMHVLFYEPLIGMDLVMEHFGKDEMTVATFPFFDRDGRVTNLCCRVTDDDYTEVFKYFFSHGRTSLFNLNNIDPSKPFFVFEGVTDTLAAERHGVPSVAVGCSTLSEEHEALLAEFPHAVLCLDGDVAGAAGMARSRIAHKFPLPKGYDVDDILKEDPDYGQRVLARVLARVALD